VLDDAVLEAGSLGDGGSGCVSTNLGSQRRCGGTTKEKRQDTE
jgi:hypothetical protein